MSLDPLGYVYSNGSALCVKHAVDLTDENSGTGLAGPVFSTEERHSDLSCDVPGCGFIQEQNVFVEDCDQ